MSNLNRRGLLRAATLIGAGAVPLLGTSAHAADATKGRHSQPTFVLVHGANGNAASFAPVLAELGMAGHRALAVDLPGHGLAGNFPLSYQAPQNVAAFAVEPSPILSRVTLADNVGHVVDVVRRVARHGPVILVGHSMGGTTITRVGNAVPHLIRRLVYLTAFCCVEFRSAIDCFLTPEGATTLIPTIPSVGNPEHLGVTRTNWRSADPDFIAAARAALAEGYDDMVFRSVLNSMEPDESTAVPSDDARGNPATWGTIPRSYIRCTLDRTIPVALQDRMIREADRATPRNPFDVHTLAAPHLGPQDPRVVAEILGHLS
jgi:pimeloyl-ACP methyl ester carboxylesterase